MSEAENVTPMKAPEVDPENVTSDEFAAMCERLFPRESQIVIQQVIIAKYRQAAQSEED